MLSLGKLTASLLSESSGRRHAKRIVSFGNSGEGNTANCNDLRKRTQLQKCTSSFGLLAKNEDWKHFFVQFTVVMRLSKVWHGLKAYFVRQHAVGSEDIMAVVESLAIVSALALTAVLGLMFVPDAAELEATDRFFKPNHTATTYLQAREENLPSATMVTRGFHCQVLSMIIFGGSLLLILSASESGRRPVIGGDELEELQRALHTGLWYQRFRAVLMLLIILLVVDLFLLQQLALDMINVRYPLYGGPLSKAVFEGPEENGAYASYLRNIDYSRFLVPLLAVFIIVQHFRVFFTAKDRQYLAPRVQLEARLSQLLNDQREARAPDDVKNDPVMAFN
eukprot:TRINITY_DN7110_c0_g1_i1.p1 TRINITY_DN7110_c0_g1~~TRINITY_DN7110_c0_g1_i1.p1  ORF type:complete len:337 (+),score=70.18 TRINITY_DN7110_c0_g1_i1:809-1819(+)